MPQTLAETEPRREAARILVLEDEPLIRFAMAEALRELGILVVEAASADEAWQYLLAGGSVDLDFTDHRMPGSMTGAHLAARIRQHYSIGVVLTSAFFHDLEWSVVVPEPYNLTLRAATALAKEAVRLRQKECGL